MVLLRKLGSFVYTFSKPVIFRIIFQFFGNALLILEVLHS